MNDDAAKLTEYLRRVGFHGVAGPDIDCLEELQRVHVRTVPFENLDVQLRRPVVLDHDACFDKIVRRRRGGWCFELNGVLGWALREIGFDVVRLCGGVMRERLGDDQMGNHLCLLVRLDRPYLVDVGFGSSQLKPLALQESEHYHAPYRITLKQLGGGQWRLSEQARGDPFGYDFYTTTADEALFAEKCTLLQTHAASAFTQNLVVKRRSGSTHLTLRGRVLATLRDSAEEKRLLMSAEDLVATLRNDFDLDVPEAATLWPAICARHETLFGNTG